jgi:2-methylcitrate dehydratase PrpD
MELMQRLVKNVLKTKYQDLPRESIDITKLAILDTFGCIIAGATAPGCNLVRELVLDWGGKKESTIMIYGDKVPCPNAAFVNSTMARALDFDSTWMRGMHMSAASIPTVLATAEICNGIDGKDLLSCIIAGEDLAARIHLATSDYNGFEPTGVCGILGLTAMTGKILGLNERRMLDALAIAFNRSAGSFQPNIDGALIIRVMEGLASRSAIESALLANKGITGGENTLEGVYGYFHLFSHDDYNTEILTNKLGTEFLGYLETPFKKYPACGGTASAIEATLQLVNENDIKAENIEKITVESNQFFHNISGNPFKIGENPQADAQFSYQYTIANSILRKGFSLYDLKEEAIRDTEILKLIEKVHTKVNNYLKDDSFHATIVYILTNDGKQFSKRVNYPRGSLQNPMNKKEVIEKFLANTNFNESLLPKNNAELIIEMIENLEEIDNVTKLIQLLSP